LFGCADFQFPTKVYLDLLQEEFVIYRTSVPTTNPRINRAPETAPHTLFTGFNALEQQEMEECLSIRAFYDVNVLKVFINSRTVISTRIYSASNTCFWIRMFADAVQTVQNDHNDHEWLSQINSCRIWNSDEEKISERDFQTHELFN
jgi:hypothetical protein